MSIQAAYWTAFKTIRLPPRVGVSLDYLVGNSDQELDSNTLKKILEVQNLPEDIQEKIHYFIDVAIKDFKTRQAYS